MKKKADPFYSPMPRIMVIAMLIGLWGCILFGALYVLKHIDWLLTCAITFGMVAYQMLVHFISPVLLWPFFHRRYDPNSWWFRQRKWEPTLYQRLNVQSWKANVPSWDPSEYSLKKHSLQQIAENMCHSEAVHELIMLLSFTSLFFAIPFGAFWAFFITSLMSSGFNSVFVILQRYNRPRITAILDRRAQRAHCL